MSCHPNDIQLTADFLLTHSKEKPYFEAMVRSSVSRSYYAFFHSVLVYAPPEIKRMRGGRKHEKTIQWMRNHKNKDIRKLGLYLDNLRLERTVCDYDIDKIIDLDVLVLESKRVFSFIKELQQIFSNQ